MEPTYAHHAKQAYPSLNELFRAGEAVEDMLSHPGWIVVQSLLAREEAGIDARLNGPRVLGHVEYAHMHGQLRGLSAAADAAQALRDRYVTVRAEQEAIYEGAGESALER